MNSIATRQAQRAAKDIRRLLIHARDLLGCLDASEQQAIRVKLVAVILAAAKKKGIDLSNAFETPEILAALDKGLEQAAAAGKATYKKQRERKPEYEKRDREIVRLRDRELRADEKQLTWKQIARKLPTIDDTWVASDGTPLDKDAVRTAYNRFKRRLANK